MTKRARGDSITLDNCDSQSLEFVQQLETGSLLIRIDHSVHDGYARNSLLSDPVIYYDDEFVVNNVIQGSGKPCPSDCFTHTMIDDVRLRYDYRELRTGNFERTSLSKQHIHKFGRSHDELATVADHDKFAESFENNYPEVCDARSLWMIDCRKLDVTDRDKTLEIHVVRNSRIKTSILGSKDYHELHNHVYVGISRLLSAKNVLIMI